MGLDIYCNKLVKTAKTPEAKEYFIRCVFDTVTKRYTDWDFPKWTQEYKRLSTETVYDWGKYRDKTGFNIDENYLFSEEWSEQGHFWQFYSKDSEELFDKLKHGNFKNAAEYRKALNDIIITIKDEDVPRTKIKVNHIYYKEVGYQRKGLNNQFYKDFDNGKIGEYVWTLAELERYKNEYCDTEQQKKNFQTNIIDNFKEGKCFVEFNW